MNNNLHNISSLKAINIGGIIYFIGILSIALAIILFFNHFIPTRLLLLLSGLGFLLVIRLVGTDRIFILLISLSYIPLVFTLAGVKGWDIKDIILPLLLLWWLGQSLIKREALNRVPRFSIFLFLFLLVAIAHIFTLKELPEIISSFISFKIPAGQLRIFYTLFLSGAVCFLSPFLFKKKSQIKLLVILLAGISLLLIVFNLLRIYPGINISFPEEAYDMRIHYIQSGRHLIPRLPVLGTAGYFLFIVTLIFIKNRYSLLFLVLAGLSITAIVVSGGRTVFLGVIFAISFYLFLTGKKAGAILIPFGTLLIILIISLHPKIVAKAPALLQRHLEIFSSKNPSLSRNENTRLEMWSISWRIISRHPFWGARSVEDIWRYNQAALVNVKKGGAHNTYLSIAAMTGLPALFLWLAAAILYFKRIINLYRKTSDDPLINKFCLMLAVLLGVSLLMFFFKGYVGGGFVYFLYLGLIDSAWRIYHDSQSLTEPAKGSVCSQ